MEITYSVIVAIVTYILGAINKAFFDNLPNKYIPLQNVLIGFISGLVCYYTGVETNMLQSVILCLIASNAAGGIADIGKVYEKE